MICNVLPYGQYAFVTHAPGSTELYIIPNRWWDDFIKWCLCELFDERWAEYQQFFEAYRVVNIKQQSGD